MERIPLSDRIEHLLGHEPRTRDEIAFAVGYTGHDVSMTEALAHLVGNGLAIRTPAGWRAPTNQPRACPGRRRTVASA
jgi:hypothetical protein